MEVIKTIGENYMSFDQKKYIDEWNKENYERVPIRVPKGKKELLKKTADKNGMSVNKLIIEAVEDKYKINLSK